MPSQLLSSKIVVEEESPRIRTLQGVQTSVLLAAGITERGPFTPTQVTSFAEFTEIYGGDTADSELVHSIRAFFEEGGQNAWIQRVVHYTTIDDPLTKTSAAAGVALMSAATSPGAGSVTGSIPGPWALTPGDTLSIAVDGGGAALATFDAAAASRTAGATENYALTDGMTLTLEIDGGPVQTVTFDTAEFATIGAATAAEVAAVINAEVTGIFADTSAGAVRITTDAQGTDASINVTGGTANAVLTFTTGIINGTGDVGDINAVTFAEAKALIEADVAGVTVTEETGGELTITSNTTGASSSILVEAASTADDEFGLDNATHSGTTGAAQNIADVDAKYDGTYGNDLSIIIADATDGETDHFNLTVEDDGVVRETYANLSAVATDDRFADTILNDEDTGSLLVTWDDKAIGARPANGTYGPMTGGDDGLTSIADTDFIGSAVSATGFHGFDTIDAGNLLICPDRATPAVHSAMLSFCEEDREMSCFAILDPPADLTASEMVTYVKTTAGLKQLSEFGAIYYPRVKVLNPSQDVFGTAANITVAPSGAIAGVFARTDASRVGGVYDPPAGVERGQLTSIVGFESDETKDRAKRDLLYPELINPLSPKNGQRIIDGVRTLKSNGNFPTIAERRGVIFIEQSLKEGLEFARFANNDERLRATVDRVSRLFLTQQMNVGAFRSRNPATAFQVNVGEDLNPPSVVFAGQLIMTLGLATQKPAEFIIIRVSQDTRALEQEIGA